MSKPTDAFVYDPHMLFYKSAVGQFHYHIIIELDANLQPGTVS